MIRGHAPVFADYSIRPILVCGHRSIRSFRAAERRLLRSVLPQWKAGLPRVRIRPVRSWFDPGDSGTLVSAHEIHVPILTYSEDYADPSVSVDGKALFVQAVFLAGRLWEQESRKARRLGVGRWIDNRFRQGRCAGWMNCTRPWLYLPTSAVAADCPQLVLRFSRFEEYGLIEQSLILREYVRTRLTLGDVRAYELLIFAGGNP